MVIPKGRSAKAHLHDQDHTLRWRTCSCSLFRHLSIGTSLRGKVLRHIYIDQATCSRPHIEVETMLMQPIQAAQHWYIPKGKSAKAHLHDQDHTLRWRPCSCSLFRQLSIGISIRGKVLRHIYMIKTTH